MWRRYLMGSVLPSSAEVKECVELYLHSPNTSSWRRTQWSTGTANKTNQICSKRCDFRGALRVTHFWIGDEAKKSVESWKVCSIYESTELWRGHVLRTRDGCSAKTRGRHAVGDRRRYGGSKVNGARTDQNGANACGWWCRPISSLRIVDRSVATFNTYWTDKSLFHIQASSTRNPFLCTLIRILYLGIWIPVSQRFRSVEFIPKFRCGFPKIDEQVQILWAKTEIFKQWVYPRYTEGNISPD